MLQRQTHTHLNCFSDGEIMPAQSQENLIDISSVLQLRPCECKSNTQCYYSGVRPPEPVCEIVLDNKHAQQRVSTCIGPRYLPSPLIAVISCSYTRTSTPFFRRATARTSPAIPPPAISTRTGREESRNSLSSDMARPSDPSRTPCGKACGTLTC